MNLKQIRKSRGYTQQEVAERVGISQNNYSYWENGKVKIDSESLKKLAEIFNVSVDYLIAGDEDTSLISEKYRWLETVSSNQMLLFQMIQKLDNDRFFMVYGYTERLLREMI